MLVVQNLYYVMPSIACVVVLYILVLNSYVLCEGILYVIVRYIHRPIFCTRKMMGVRWVVVEQYECDLEKW